MSIGVPLHERHGSRSRLLRACLTCFGFATIGVALVALTNRVVIWSSSDAYCGGACHSMSWANATYQRGPHYTNTVGVRASCGACHIPFDAGHATATEYLKLLLFKANRGAKDTWYEVSKSIATKEEWEKRRAALSNTFERYLKQHNYITCRGCHSLQSFAGPRSQMKLIIHSGLVKADSYACLECHSNIGHVYEKRTSRAEGWYATEQAAAGEKLFEHFCSACHGAKLQGTTGAPALSGETWKQRFEGAKLLTVWGLIKGPMAEYAGAAFTTQQSLDILSFLLQQNGLPAGKEALSDTRELSDTLP